MRLSASKWLRQVVKGDFNDRAVPTNSRALSAFRFFVTERWQRALRRRGEAISNKISTARLSGHHRRDRAICGSWLRHAKPARAYPGGRTRDRTLDLSRVKETLSR